MASGTYEDLLLKKNLADLIDKIPIGADFQVTPQQRAEMSNSSWTPMMRRVFISDVNKTTQGVPAEILHNYKEPTNEELAELDPTTADYEMFLKLKRLENKEKIESTKLTDAIREAKFVVGVMPEPEDVRREPLSEEANLKHEANVRMAKDMIRLMHYLPEGTEPEVWQNGVNGINSIIRGDYGGAGD